MAITHASMFSLLSLIRGTSFNIRPTEIPYVNKHLPKKIQKKEFKKRMKKTVKQLFSLSFLYLRCVHVCVCVIHVIVWVDLDNSNKLNGMQSL